MEKISLFASALEPHVNRVPVDGILTFADQFSERSPSGARGRRILLTKSAVERALDSLLGTPLCFGNNNHNKNKVGVITGAVLSDNAVEISGFLYGWSFPEVVREIRTNKYGMSYEITDVAIDNVYNPIEWRAKDFIFTGAAILPEDKVAYRNTRINISNRKSEEKCEVLSIQF